MAVALLAAGPVPLASPAHAATARQPVLFVHGYNSDGSTWDTMRQRFRSAGYADSELFAWSYDWRRSNTQTAQALATKVDGIRSSTGWNKVNIVSHSMGGLSSRWYLKRLGGKYKVDDWVSLGGPNHGTDSAHLCRDPSCVEMRPGSEFLVKLNNYDESPGRTAYATWRSPCDAVINPDSSVVVAGATNTKTACLGHTQLHDDATIFGQVRAAVAE